MTYDPDQGLEVIRALIKDYQGHPDGLEFEQVEELVREVAALDRHCAYGGKFPSWWCQGTLTPYGWGSDDIGPPEWEDEPPPGRRIHSVTTSGGFLTDDAQDDSARPGQPGDSPVRASRGKSLDDDPA
jgi:hypothetical protein